MRLMAQLRVRMCRWMGGLLEFVQLSCGIFTRLVQ